MGTSSPRASCSLLVGAETPCPSPTNGERRPFLPAGLPRRHHLIYLHLRALRRGQCSPCTSSELLVWWGRTRVTWAGGTRSSLSPPARSFIGDPGRERGLCQRADCQAQSCLPCRALLGTSPGKETSFVVSDHTAPPGPPGLVCGSRAQRPQSIGGKEMRRRAQESTGCGPHTQESVSSLLCRAQVPFPSPGLIPVSPKRTCPWPWEPLPPWELWCTPFRKPSPRRQARVPVSHRKGRGLGGDRGERSI